MTMLLELATQLSGPSRAMRMGDVGAGIKDGNLKLKVERVQFDDYSKSARWRACNRRVGSARCGLAEPSGKVAPMGHKSIYKDSWAESLILDICVGRISKITGVSTSVKGYDGLVEVTRKVMQSRSPLLQRESSMRVLLSAIPPWLLKIIRIFYPNTQKSAENLANRTFVAAGFLIGPCEVKEVEVNGVMQKSGVLIKKCRYLESSNCVGMCVNMCKIPTQDFFANSLDLPVTMTPNFEDMSCEMIYGKVPLPIEEDPALQQPCFATLCPTARKKASTCSKASPPGLVVSTN